MQEPIWKEVFSYAISGLERGEWPYVKFVAFGLLFVLLRILVSWAWARHAQQQQLSIIRSIFLRWVEGVGQPFWTLSTSSPLDAIGRLRSALAGNVDMVIALLIGLRVQLETWSLDEQVLLAVDSLTAEWEDKTVHARRRRYRKLRGLARASGGLAVQGPQAGDI
jgi:hypothetical protein